LTTANRHLQTAIRDLQHICDSLTPLTLIDMGLEDALHETIAGMIKRYNITLTMPLFDASIESIGAAEKLNIFRIVNDLLNAIVIYAHASSIRMSFFYQPGGTQLRLDYTGDAFGKLSDTRELQNVRDRIEFYNGNLRYIDTPSSRSVDIHLVRNAT
jgi:signal transduction histidine kinase